MTRDSSTGEVIEDRHARTNPARAHAALQRLDRVRDIETVVTLLDKLEGAGHFPNARGDPISGAGHFPNAHGDPIPSTHDEFVDLTVDSGNEEIGLLEP